MKRQQLLDLFDCDQTELADLLGYTPSAVSQWGDEEDVPAKPYLRLRYQIAPHLSWPDSKGAANAAQ